MLAASVTSARPGLIDAAIGRKRNHDVRPARGRADRRHVTGRDRPNGAEALVGRGARRAGGRQLRQRPLHRARDCPDAEEK